MNLTSNIFPIEIPFDHFQVQRVVWEEGKLENLRQQHNQEYSFFKKGDYIYISPGKDNLPSLGKLETLKVEDEPLVVLSLIRHIFFRTFKDKFPHIKPTFNPFTFPSTKDDHNLILNELPDNLKSSISYKKLNELDFKRSEIQNKKKFLLVISSSYKWALRKNCEKLIESGFDIINLEVARLLRHESSKEVVAPTFELIGRVKSITGSSAVIETNNGNEIFQLNDLYLNKSYENIRLYLESVLGSSKAENIIRKVKQNEFYRNDPTILYQEIYQLANHISQLDFKNGDSFFFTINKKGTVQFPVLNLDNPNYLFDVSFGKTHTSPSKGLDKFGPYDYGKFFEVSHPKVLVVFHKDSSGAFTEFLGRLRDGFNESRTFSKGFLAMYRLHAIDFHLVEVESFSKDVFLEAIKKAVNSNEKNFDIAIVETKEEFKRSPPSEDLYWVSKAYLLQHGITVQSIKEVNARNPKFILDSFALQMYAKLGGAPWILPSSPNIAHELIIGIGSTTIRNNNYSGSQQSRVVGITTFFNADGKYIFSDRSKEVAYQDYFNELLVSLKGSIDIISREQAWTDGAIVRIVFHVFKPMRDVEVDVVGKLIEQYPQYDIKFSFVSFGENHPYMIFDLDQQAIPSKFSRNLKGKFTPARGTNFLIEPGICLLQLKGPEDIKTDKQGFTGPLIIRIHRKSTFTDATYIVQQVYRLTNISYRSFSPSQLPVTLFYAELITEQLNKLKTIEGWDPLYIKPLRNRKWFL